MLMISPSRSDRQEGAQPPPPRLETRGLIPPAVVSASGISHVAGDHGRQQRRLDLKLVRKHKNGKRTRKINLVGMWHADNNTPIASIAEDFDLQQCSISLTAAPDNGLLSYTFNDRGGARYAREYRRSEADAADGFGGRSSRRTKMRMGHGGGPRARPGPAGRRSGPVRGVAAFSVRRQMDRIAKYLARGYEWAERPREQPVERENEHEREDSDPCAHECD